MNATTWVVEKLKAHLGLSTDRELLDRLHIDTFDTRGLDLHDGVMPAFVGPEHPSLCAEWSGNILALWGVEEKVIETESGKMFSQFVFPLKDAESLEELADYPWPDPDWFDYEHLRERLLPWSDRSVIVTGVSVWQHPSFVRGLDTLLMDLVLNPGLATYVFDRFTEFYHEFYSRILSRVADLVDSLAMADDFGMQSGLMVSPEMFEEWILPRIRMFAELAHSHGLKLILHSDGNIRSVIPRLIDAGVDVLDPLQPEAENMNPAEIKAEFGDRLVLRGGISAQNTLSRGSKHDVEDEVKRTIDALAPGGGYILSPGHPVLQDDIPAENIIAMYDTAYAYGAYR
jgi:uroporphyrinogen decarboxylase